MASALPDVYSMRTCNRSWRSVVGRSGLSHPLWWACLHWSWNKCCGPGTEKDSLLTQHASLSFTWRLAFGRNRKTKTFWNACGNVLVNHIYFHHPDSSDHHCVSQWPPLVTHLVAPMWTMVDDALRVMSITVIFIATNKFWPQAIGSHVHDVQAGYQQKMLTEINHDYAFCF